MQLIARLSVFSVLCLASLAAPLSQPQAIPAQDPENKFDHDIKISDVLIALTQTATPFKLPQESTSAAERSAGHPTSVAPPPEEKFPNPKSTPFKLPHESASTTETSSSDPTSVAAPPEQKFPNPKTTPFKKPHESVSTVEPSATDDRSTNTEVHSASSTDSPTSTGPLKSAFDPIGTRFGLGSGWSGSGFGVEPTSLTSSRESISATETSVIDPTSNVSHPKDSFTHAKSTSTNTEHASFTATPLDPFRTEVSSSAATLFSTVDVLPVIESIGRQISIHIPSVPSTTDAFTVVTFPAESSIATIPTPSSPDSADDSTPSDVFQTPTVKAEDHGGGGFFGAGGLWGGCVVC